MFNKHNKFSTMKFFASDNDDSECYFKLYFEVIVDQTFIRYAVCYKNVLYVI